MNCVSISSVEWRSSSPGVAALGLRGRFPLLPGPSVLQQFVDRDLVLLGHEGHPDLPKIRAKLFSSLFRRRKHVLKGSPSDDVARRLIDVSQYLGARRPREAAEMSMGRSLTDDEWTQISNKWERVWRENPTVTEPLLRLYRAISTITDEPIARKNATTNAASAAAMLTTAIVRETISTIGDDDDRFVVGIFAFVFSNYFTLVLEGSFEEAAVLAVIEVLGLKDFHRSFNTIQEGYNQMSQSRPKVVEGISSACEAWFKNPEPSQFERLAELFKILRTHVGARR
jgi:hypothetical protein